MSWLPADWSLGDGRLWAAGAGLAFAVTVALMPLAIRKLRGARIVGKDRHKPGRPDVAEMGGLGLFAGLMAGSVVMLAASGLTAPDSSMALAALLAVSGAALVGVLDDLIALRQRFKAVLPFAFAAPLALFVQDTAVAFPWGTVDFGLLYPLLLVPLGVACASNGANMLEGFNGLGAGLALIIASALSVLAILTGNHLGLVVLIPLAAACLGFLLFNFHPARAFPGDVGTLTMGAALAVGAMLGKLEFPGALMFLLVVAEFLVKARNGFPTVGWGGDLRDGKLYAPPKRPVGLAQMLLKATGGVHERTLVLLFYALQAALCAAVVVAFA